MKKNIFILAILLTFASAYAIAATDVIYLTNGKKYYGEVVDMTEKTITIKTSVGKLTYPWERLKLKSLKKYNPSLYQQIRKKKLAELEIKKKKLGLVKYEKNGRIRWVLPKVKKELEMKDKGYEFFEDEWLPTNKIAEILFDRKMKAEGKTKYNGKWYTDEELADVKATEMYKGLKEGMTESEVKAKWGEPTSVKESQSFKSKKAKMWFYEHPENETENRVYFENGMVRKIQMDRELSEK